MDTTKISIPMTQMIPIIRAAVQDGGQAEITVTGNSMKPLLLDRISSVKLAKADNLKKGDIVLFQRNDDRYVLHRIITVHDGGYDIIGDNQYVPDRNVSQSAIIAKVVSYNRTGKGWKQRDSIYRIFLPVIKSVRYYGCRMKPFFKLSR